MSDFVQFFVPGVPQPGGSKRGYPVKTKTGKVRVAIVEDARHNAPWRAKVSLAASSHFDTPFRGPVEAHFEFVMPRPKRHYGTGRRASFLRPDAATAHTIYPDTTKLIRSTEDALKGIAWMDDAQVVAQSAVKFYGEPPGCLLRIRKLGLGARLRRWLLEWTANLSRLSADSTEDSEEE